MKQAEWESPLRKAAQGARAAVLALGEGGRERVGTGASGDRTLAADRAAEDAIIESLRGVQGLRFLSEEAGEVGDEESPMVAVIDPVDGSSNYRRGIPFYCVSIAVAEGPRLSDVAAGLVLDLVTGDEYFASKAGGATKNGNPIRASANEDLSKAVAGLDLSGLRGPRIAEAMKVVEGTRRQLHLGANALELCLLAAGNLDCFVDVRGKMRVTDVAAGLMILAEAGGVHRMEDGSGSDPLLTLDERLSVIASGNGRLQERVLSLLGRR